MLSTGCAVGGCGVYSSAELFPRGVGGPGGCCCKAGLLLRMALVLFRAVEPGAPTCVAPLGETTAVAPKGASEDVDNGALPNITALKVIRSSIVLSSSYE